MSAAVQQSGFGHTTTFEEFADLARDHRVVPVTRRCSPTPKPRLGVPEAGR